MILNSLFLPVLQLSDDLINHTQKNSRRIASHLKTLGALALSVFLLCSCQNNFSLKQVAKSDVDMVGDAFIEQNTVLLKELMAKLYKRNPKELAKMPGMTVEARVDQLFSRRALVFAELGGMRETEAMELAFKPDFQGDRVFALMSGLVGMFRHAYNYYAELFVVRSVQAEKLFKSARNIEVLLWKLKNSKNPEGEYLILSHSSKGITDNLSFERLFGKLIAHQDMMAIIISGKDQRMVNFVVHRFSSVFLPL